MSLPPPHNDGPVRVEHQRDVPSGAFDLRSGRRTLLYAILAFAIGLLLFAMLWWRERGNDDFYRAEGALPPSQGQSFEPLPAPLPAEQAPGNASGLGQAQTGVAPAPPSVQRPRPPAPPPEARPSSPPLAGAGPGPASTPVPIESPSPRYPIDALRNRESGTVLLRVHVGADGIPVAIDLVRSSRSRSLDRAATEAVRRWRFRPALRNGQPVSGELQVPISFRAEG